MIDNLINKLRAVDHLSLEDCFCQSSLYDKAANRIEQLTGEVQRWQGMFDEKHNLMLEHKARAEAAEAERDRLRAALEDIADHDTGATAGLAYTAKIALKGETP